MIIRYKIMKLTKNTTDYKQAVNLTTHWVHMHQSNMKLEKKVL